MAFIKEEHLYTTGGLSINGKQGFKYADIILGYGENYYHAVFFKFQNFFTIMMDDYQTFPTMEIASKVLTMLSEADITGPASEKIDNEKIKVLLSDLNPDKNYYKIGNYIVRTAEKTVPYKKTEFLLNSMIPLANVNACITNMGTRLQVTINNENKQKLDRYDKVFFVSAAGEIVFKELMCLKAFPDIDNVVLDLFSEHEYFMKHSQMNGMKITGNLLWTLQVMEYSLNKDRDNPIEMRKEGKSLNTGKRRFFFLFSIRGLEIKTDVRFGLVTFSNESGIDIDRENEYTAILGKTNHCYAQVAIVNESLRMAAEEAVKVVDKAITLLQIILLDDSPRIFYNTKDTYRSWNFKMLSSSLTVDKHFYVEDVISTQQYAILNRKNSLITQLITVDEEFSDLLNKDNILEDFFYLDKSKDKRKLAEDLLQSIVWLNASLKTEDSKEKIISLYNCLEFLVTGEKGTLLSQELHLAYGSEYDSSIEGIKKVINEIQNEELRERIGGVIKSSFEGNSSLQSKLESLIDRLPITFEDRDWELFNKLKKNRQKLIHNKKISAPITNQELNELFHLFSKVIIYRIIDISNGGKND
ncbi:hypothetical protein BHF69_06265 [Anaerostipes sp. 992a]|uniref:hypothetical protein n=1 Tax=Anaerostipes sp. 992a TaxID=1261637 RepID=UPI0009515AD4|nr:hypothetical protein [Anaerostipes sp. 992a]OLR62315.1 hypothetical protein BHF69_06265 [Anaerostipes sp. 992a]